MLNWLAGYALVLCLYHVVLFAVTRLSRFRTTQQKLGQLRTAWMKQIRSKNSILAVQTLRNWNMSSTFLASAALIIASGLLSVVFNQQIANGLSLSALPELSHKLFLIAFLFLLAFLNFSLCLRAFNHAGYLAEVTQTDELKDEQISAMLIKLLSSGARHYTLGMRCFYIAMPPAFWLFGDVWFIGATIAMLMFLYYVDALSA